MRLFMLFSSFICSVSLSAQSINLLDYIDALCTSTHGDFVTECFQEAVDAAFVSNKPLFIPAGDYKIDSTINMKDVSVFGEGSSETNIIFHLPSGASGFLFDKRFNNRYLRDLSISAWNSAPDIFIINYQEGIFNSIVENLEISGPFVADISNQETIGLRVNTSKFGEETRESNNNLFSKLSFKSRFNYAFAIMGDTIDNELPHVFNANKFDKCRFSGHKVQVRLLRAEGNSFHNCTWAENPTSEGTDAIRIEQWGGNSTLLESCYFDGAGDDGFVTVHTNSSTWTPVYTIGLLNDCGKIKIIGTGAAEAVCFMDRRTASLNMSKLNLNGVDGSVRFEEPDGFLNYIDVEPNTIKVYGHQGQLKVKNEDQDVFVAGAQKIYFGSNQQDQILQNYSAILFDNELINMGGFSLRNGNVKTGEWGKSLYEVNVSINFEAINSADSKIKCRLFRNGNNPISKWFYSNNVKHIPDSLSFETASIEFNTLISIGNNQQIRCKCDLVDGSDNVTVLAEEAEITVKRIADQKTTIDYE